MRTVVLLLALAIMPFASAATGADCTDIRARFVKDAHNGLRNYSMALCAARDGKSDDAFTYLHAAASYGFRDVDLMLADPALRPLHSDRRWRGAVSAVVLAGLHASRDINGELLALFETDQADRRVQNIDWNAVSARDSKRLARVRALLAAGAAKEADDFYHAAMVFQHGETADDFRLARDNALVAYEKGGSKRAAWLACAAEDRWLHRTGKPQVWGTQFMGVRGKGTSAWTLEPFDRSAKTDAEREAMGVPSLAASEARLKAMNGR